MQAINIMFSLFGLILGLGISGLLNNFATAWRINAGVGTDKSTIRFGWLVPLLGALVIMDMTEFYLTAYQLRETVPLTRLSLLCVMVVVGIYYMCSTFVFPEAPSDWPDFDEYYMRTKRIVAWGILGTNLAILIFAGILVAGGHEYANSADDSAAGLLLGLAFMPLITALIFVRGKRANLVLLVLLNLNLVASAVVPLFF